MSAHATVDEVLEFWFGEPATTPGELGRKMRRWYMGGAAMDEEVTRRFGSTVEAALRGELEGWLDHPKGWLALVLVLDQFTRNVFRDVPRMYEGDARAQALALGALDAGAAEACSSEERNFAIMPLVHSERLEHQERGVLEMARHVEEAPAALRPIYGMGIEQTRKYHDIIARFGRFPHRNAVLGRKSTPEELEFLVDWKAKQPPSGAAELAKG